MSVVDNGANPRFGADIGANPRFGKRSVEDDLGAIGGGFALKRAWLFDGYYWTEIADMHIVRDRPACSVLEMPDGTVSIARARVMIP